MGDVRCRMIYPRFVYERQWDKSEAFNDALYEVATRDAAANRVPKGGHAKAIGEKTTHLAHLRHNFLMEQKHPCVAELACMVDKAVRDYLQLVYAYQHEGPVRMMSDTFYQSRERGENVGINCHTHFRTDIVATYYVRTGIEEGETNPLRMGALRFYDPQNLGERPWPNNNPQICTSGWANVIPSNGLMVLFEGHMPHDSTYFGGSERLCIPVMCEVATPRSHIKASLPEILIFQEG